MSAGLAKNVVRRALRAVVDPEPSKRAIASLWEYFKSACSYCGRRLDKAGRLGHIDHLVHNGSNHVSNRVLACHSCNGDEKREGAWLPFLRKKAGSQKIFAERKRRIEKWVATQAPATPLKFDTALLQREIDAVVRTFDRALVRLRRTRIRA